jgi:ribonucrease Y
MSDILIGLLLVLVAVLIFYIFKTKKTEPKTSELLEIRASLEKEIRQEYESKTENEKSKIKEDLEDKNQLILAKTKLELQSQLQKEEKEMRQRILDLQENLDKKETQLDLKLEKIDGDRKQIDEIKQELRKIKEDLLNKKAQVEEKERVLEETLQNKLQEIAKLTHSEAKNKILETAKEEMGNELIHYQQKIVTLAEEQANIKAREIVTLAVQRCSSEVANEITITTIPLSSEEDKGKIIGKQGRNIQWLEKTLGVEIVIDETPEIVTLSGFSSVRRNIAKKTLQKLLADGRITPPTIEEMHEKAKAEIAQEIAEVGEQVVTDLGIYDFPAKLVRLIGRLQYRTSYGQNMLRHSIEMARLAGLIADEINDKFPNRENPVDKIICMKGALLHDIGKAIDEESSPKGNHIEIGEKICDMFDLDWKIKKCISSHHDESYYDPEKGFCIEAVVVDACDGISGGRLGARKETADAYFQRMEGMEKIANATPGVSKSWIMRGTKEMWVFFDTQQITPAKMHDTTRKIAQQISSGVTSPVKIKVIGFYEDRAVEYAG